MSANNGEGLPDREQLVQAVEAAQKAHKAQTAATSLRDKAKRLTNAKERERMLQEAYDAEIEANGYSKMAKRLQSGTWQGGGIGGGIGAGVGLGLGTVVGTLVGGVAAIPTTGLGILAGATAGAIHGPFIKVPGGGEKRIEDAQPEEIVDVIEQEQNGQRRAQLEERVGQAGDDIEARPKSKKKPRKLEVRSLSQPDQTRLEPLERRKPRKIERRSGI